jgi:DNA-binding beta-propeller fold protein YncE
MRVSIALLVAAIAASAGFAVAQTTKESAPYKVLQITKVGGEGGFDYVYADSDSRKLFIVRSGRLGRCDMYDLDSLKMVDTIPGVNNGHGVAVDTKSGHGFTSSNPVVMFDVNTRVTIKTIPVEGNPDGIFFEPATEHIFVLSHRQPNVTVINGTDGSIVGTIDLGGSPEQGASDGKGHCYIDLEDQAAVAVVDANANKLTATYSLGDKGGSPGGLALDAANGIIFSFCHDPQNCVILNAADGKIIDTLPIGNGVDAAEFNPNTMEAFSSQGDGTLTIIKENSPTSFEVEQTVKTKLGAKCSTIDLKTGNIYLTTADQRPAASQPAAAPSGGQVAAGGGPGGAPANGQGGGRRARRPRGGGMVPNSFQIIVVGKS